MHMCNKHPLAVQPKKPIFAEKTSSTQGFLPILRLFVGYVNYSGERQQPFQGMGAVVCAYR